MRNLLCKSVICAAICCLCFAFVGGNDDDDDDASALTDLGKTFVAVDLGLPSGTKWATFNLGATAPEESGVYYAWGETAPKEVYDLSTYFDTEDDGGTFLKYKLAEGGRTVLDPEDDAASVALGGEWRMPTRAEQDELLSNCYWVWTSTYGGKSVNGLQIVELLFLN